MSYRGDIALGSTIDLKFTTRQFSTGTPFTLAGTPTVAAYPDNSLTELTAGITLTVDFDARTGLNNIRIVATGANGYAAGSNYDLVITAGTVYAVSVVGEVVGSFSIEARSALRPLTAGRTLEVTAANKVQGVVLTDTVTTYTGNTVQTGDSFARLGAPAGASVSADIAAIEAQTDDIGVAGAGLTALGDTRIANLDATVSSRATPAQVNTEVDTALADVNLDHLVGTATGIPAIVPGTYIDQIMDDGTAVFDRLTDSLQAIRDTAPLGTAMRGTDSAALASVCTEARLAELDAANLPTDVAAVKTDTAAILIDTAAIDPKIVGTLAAGTHQPQGGDAFARLGAPAGASVSVDVAAVKTQTAAIEADTQDIQARTPAALTAGGNMKVDLLALNGNVDSPIILDRSARGIVRGTVGAASTTTSIVTSSLDPAASVTDQFKGRIVTFSKDTTTAALRGQASDITGSTSMGVLTCTAFTTAPVSGDSFTIN